MACCISRKVRFPAAHHFYLPELSEAENFKRFWKTSNRNGHGHNYEVEVAVEGEIDSTTGMVMNLTDLKHILNQVVTEPLEFKHWNLEVQFFKQNQPSLENLLIYLWHHLQPRVEEYNLTLSWIRVYEQDDIYGEYNGENHRQLAIQTGLINLAPSNSYTEKSQWFT